MKQKWFSPRLYLEGLRQLRLMGLLITAAVGLLVIFIPVGEFINTLSHDEISVLTVTYDEMNPVMVVAFCLVAPFLTINLFSFVNKRESSDYYHAIPATRTCLFFSFFAAVVTWLFLFTFGTALLSTLCHAIFPSLFAVNFLSVLQMSLNCFVGGLLVAACVAMAMSVTGTFLMNILLSLLIIFLPRILIKLVLDALCDAFPPVQGLVFAPLFNTQYNIPAGYVLQYFFGGDPANVLTSWQSCLYTLGLALAYVAVAWWLFTRRRSEGAGHSAPTPALQSLYRFLVGFTISSIVTMAFFADYGNTKYYDLSDMIGWVFLYTIALFAVVVFEILCTRRFKGLIRRLFFTTILLIVANLALIGGTLGAQALLKNYSPEPEEITSVRVLEFGDYDSGYGGKPYFSEKTKHIALSDPEILRMVSRQLHHTLDVLDISKNKYFEESYQSSSVVVSIKSGGVSRLRRLIIHEEDVELLADKLAENKGYQDVYMNLPANYSHIRSNAVFLDAKEGGDRLFSVLQAEVREIGFEKWYALLNSGTMEELWNEEYGDTAGYSPITTLYINIPAATGWSEISVPLNQSVLPKTAAAYLALHGESVGSTQRIDLLDVLASHADDCDYVEGYTYNTLTGDTDSEMFWWDGDTMVKNQDTLTAFADSLKTAVHDPIDPNQPLIFLTVSTRLKMNDENGDYWSYVQMSGYFAIPEGTVLPVDEKYLADTEKG